MCSLVCMVPWWVRVGGRHPSITGVQQIVLYLASCVDVQVRVQKCASAGSGLVVDGEVCGRVPWIQCACVADAQRAHVMAVRGYFILTCPFLVGSIQ